ncbi:MAG TPA: TonB-dependent receptor [Thermoanaerobaculia bacterium]|jgi:vitamin B12 transporter
MRVRVAALGVAALALSPFAIHGQSQPAPAANGAGADPGPPFEESIVVTANRVESEADTVGSSVTVIGSDEIERRQKTTVLELLRTVPGIEVSETSSLGKVASVFIRGANSNQTLVLIDGVRANDTSAGGFNFADLLTDNIERIEILRGPQSTLYGSEAIGGVISITTRRGEPGFHGEVQGEAGNYRFRESRLLVNGGSGRFDYSTSISGLRADGVSAASTRLGNTEPDPYSNTTLSGRFGAGFLEDGRADLTVRSIRGKAALDGFTDHPVDDLNYTQDRHLLQTALQLTKPLASWWRQTVRLGADDDRIVGHDPDTFFNNYDILSRVRDVGLQSDLRLAGNDTLVLGYDGEKRSAESRGAYSKDLSVRSFFVQDLWSWRQRLYLTGGARNDNYSNFGGKTTYRLTGSFLAAAATRLHASYGTGFRAPTFDELFYPGAGNPDLRPESSRGSDVGVEQSWMKGDVSADLTYFRNRFDNLIDFDLTTFLFNNITSAKSDGLEATLKLRPARWLELASSFTYNRTENLSTGQPLARRPRRRAALTAALQPTDRFSGTLSVFAVQDRVDSSGQPMDNYARVDLTMEYRVSSVIRTYVRVQNLLDRDYEEIPGYTTPGRSAVFGVRAGIF